MKKIIKKPFSQDGLFNLKNKDYYNNQKIAGKIAANILNYIKSLIISKTNKTNLSAIEINQIVDNMIVDSNAIPTFKDYKGFPASICVSINEQLVHGIPNDYKLQDGDVVSLDLGVTYNGAIADIATTCIFGSPKYDWHVKLINTTKEALNKAINAIAIDKRMGVIGNAIFKYANNNGYSVILNYGGHAIDIDKNGTEILHASPFISNRDNINEGFRIQPGLVLAIEPMLGIGDASTYVADDDWTVYTKSIFAHEEHTVFITDDGPEIITL